MTFLIGDGVVFVSMASNIRAIFFYLKRLWKGKSLIGRRRFQLSGRGSTDVLSYRWGNELEFRQYRVA